MSALPPKADMCGAIANVCFGPIADSSNAANGHYSINSSAIVRKFGGIVRPSALAVARLMTRRCFERHYFIVTLASAKAAGTFEGALGPDSTPKASLVKLCRNSSISAGVIGLFIFFSSYRLDVGVGSSANKETGDFAHLFYMRLVSGECRRASALYRLYRLEWRRGGSEKVHDAVAHDRRGSRQVS